jgi:hypothetical protein
MVPLGHSSGLPTCGAVPRVLARESDPELESEMRNSCTRIKNLIAGVLIIALLSACTPLIAPFDATAYENATTLKAQTLALMDNAKDPYSRHRSEVEGPGGHTARMNGAYEYAAGLGSNEISAQQWAVLVDPEGALYGHFIHRWQDEGKLGEVFIAEFKGLVSDAFDEIICLERNKDASVKCSTEKGE